MPVAGGTERIDVVVTDQGTVRQLAKDLKELAKAASFSGPNKRSDYGNAGQGIHALALKVQKGGDQMVRRAAMGFSQAVILDTPVDSGMARNNWIAQLNNASERVEEIGPFDKTGEMRIAENQALIAEYDGDMDDEIHITNNARHITPLNQGWSEQAPAGFVEAALGAASEIIQKSRILSSDD